MRPSVRWYPFHTVPLFVHGGTRRSGTGHIRHIAQALRQLFPDSWRCFGEQSGLGGAMAEEFGAAEALPWMRTMGQVWMATPELPATELTLVACAAYPRDQSPTEEEARHVATGARRGSLHQLRVRCLSIRGSGRWVEGPE